MSEDTEDSEDTPETARLHTNWLLAAELPDRVSACEPLRISVRHDRLTVEHLMIITGLRTTLDTRFSAKVFVKLCSLLSNYRNKESTYRHDNIYSLW